MAWSCKGERRANGVGRRGPQETINCTTRRLSEDQQEHSRDLHAEKASNKVQSHTVQWKTTIENAKLSICAAISVTHRYRAVMTLSMLVRRVYVTLIRTNRGIESCSVLSATGLIPPVCGRGMLWSHGY